MTNKRATENASWKGCSQSGSNFDKITWYVESVIKVRKWVWTLEARTHYQQVMLSNAYAEFGHRKGSIKRKWIVVSDCNLTDKGEKEKSVGAALELLLAVVANEK